MLCSSVIPVVKTADRPELGYVYRKAAYFFPFLIHEVVNMTWQESIKLKLFASPKGPSRCHWDVRYSHSAQYRS